MAAINYSGSQSVTGCTITTWTTSTYYSFKLTQDCKLSINGTPAINARSGDEFIIQINTPYIFDRDTKVLLSYPDASVIPPPIYEAKMTTQNNIYSASGYTTALAIPTFDALTSYDVYACVPYWKVGAANITIKITVGGVTLVSQTTYCPTSQYTLITINSSLTTTIAANSVIKLEVQNGGTSDSIVGDRVPCVLQFRNTA